MVPSRNATLQALTSNSINTACNLVSNKEWISDTHYNIHDSKINCAQLKDLPPEKVHIIWYHLYNSRKYKFFHDIRK